MELVQSLKIGVPFDRQEVFLLIVAHLTGRDDIAFVVPPSSANGNNVIHCEFFRFKLFAAIIAATIAPAAFPPLAVSQ